MKNGFDVIQEVQAPLYDTPTEDGPSFVETVGASFGYKYAPIVNKVREEFFFPNKMEDGFVPRDNIPEDLKQFGSTLLYARSQEHMDYLVSGIRSNMERRKTLSQSSFLANIASEFFDPINYIGIPVAKAATFAGSAARGATAVGGTVAVVDGARALTDPLGTTSEYALNVGSAAVLGGLFTGLANIPAARRAETFRTATKETDQAISEMDLGTPNAEIADSWFTNSWMYKGVTTPMKRALQDAAVPNEVKLDFLAIAGDSGITLKAHKAGQVVGNSVYQMAKLHDGEWVKSYDTLVNLWGKETGDGVLNPLDNLYKRKDFEEWLTRVDEKAIRGIEPASENEALAISTLNKFYTNWESRLNETGLIGNRAHYERQAVKLERRIETIEKRLQTARNADYVARLEDQLQRNQSELEMTRQTIDDLTQAGPITPPNEDIFRPRYWNRDAIAKDRQRFEAILEEWFTKNPQTIVRTKTGKLEKVDLSTNPQAINARVKDMVDGLLGLADETDPDVGYFGFGKSKHMKHRVVDIPNALVLDFIERNPVKIMKAYTARMAPRYQLAKRFGGRTIDDIVDDNFNLMIERGATVEQANAAMRDLRALHDRVVGSVLRRPDAINQKISRGLRDLAQLNYLGSAGLSAITEPARIVMEHGFGRTLKAVLGVMSDSKLRMGTKEARLAGEAIERLMGSAHLRLVDDVTNNPLRTTVIDKAKDAFYTLNLLGPITRILKDFDAIIAQHSIIDSSIKLANGTISKQDREILARYNIDETMARKIANAPWEKSDSGFYMANTESWTNTIEFPSTKADIVSGPTDTYHPNGRYKPAFYRKSENRIYIDEDYIRTDMWKEQAWKKPKVDGVRPIKDGIINSPDDLVTFIKMHEIMHTIHRPKDLGIDMRKKTSKADYENAINDLAVAEIQKQTRVEPETVEAFRSALNSSIMNTILMGTPADKPIITDGIAYIPMRVARQFGMKEDSVYRGYARIESGLLGLPFQFMSYALAAVNKTTAAYGHGQLKSQYIGTAMSLGLGYMLLDYKTPDFVDLSMEDKFARSFDYSGIAPLYSDLFYTAMSTSLALNGPNLTGEFLQPKFPQEASIPDAITGLAGAGPSIGFDLARGMYDFVTGNYGEGSKDIIRNLPFMRLWFIKDHVNSMTNMLEKELNDGPVGFGRY